MGIPLHCIGRIHTAYSFSGTLIFGYSGRAGLPLLISLTNIQLEYRSGFLHFRHLKIFGRKMREAAHQDDVLGEGLTVDTPGTWVSIHWGKLSKNGVKITKVGTFRVNSP